MYTSGKLIVSRYTADSISTDAERFTIMCALVFVCICVVHMYTTSHHYDCMLFLQFIVSPLFPCAIPSANLNCSTDCCNVSAQFIFSTMYNTITIIVLEPCITLQCLNFLTVQSIRMVAEKYGCCFREYLDLMWVHTVYYTVVLYKCKHYIIILRIFMYVYPI